MGASEPALSIPQDQRHCPEHPDRLARGTCARCGRFVCAECAEAGAGLNCASCVGLLMSAVPDGAALARWSAWLLYAGAGVSLLALAVVALEVLPGVLALLELIQALLFISTAVTFLRWLHRSVRLAQALDGDVGATPGWAVGYWFVPIVNLYRPYQILGRLAAVAAAALPSGLLGWWWAAWLASNLLDRAVASDANLISGVNAASHVVHTLAAITFAAVIGRIDRGLTRYRLAFPVASPRLSPGAAPIPG